MEIPEDIAPLIPAATVVLLRDGASGLETLMLRRNRSLKAFGGLWVFPGGRVDRADAPGSDDALIKARAAAQRETMEETGLDVKGGDLISLSYWIPPVQEKRRFSTRFFICRAPGAPVKIDEGEIHDYRWVNVKDAVSHTPNPDLQIVPPTFVSLCTLAAYKDVDEALAQTAALPDEVFETRFIPHSGGFITLWQPDVGYETLNLDAPGPRRRLTTGPQAWVYERDF